MERALVSARREDPSGSIGSAILRFVSDVPRSDEPASRDPLARSEAIARSAARRAAMLSGTLALPPGPLGWLTLLPELLGVWRIQAGMVADIAAAHGRTAVLSREQMLYCLFRHAAAQAVRDLAVRAGERMIVRQVSTRVMEDMATRVGTRVVRRVAGKGVARWIPAIGAIGVSAYAYYDTMQVARTALSLCSGDQGPV